MQVGCNVDGAFRRTDPANGRPPLAVPAGSAYRPFRVSPCSAALVPAVALSLAVPASRGLAGVFPGASFTSGDPDCSALEGVDPIL